MLRRHGEGDGRRILTSDEYGHYGFTQMARLTSTSLRVALAPVEPSTRVSFWRAFGITPDTQLSIERKFANTNLQITLEHKLSRNGKRDFDESAAKLPEFIRYAFQKDSAEV